MKYMVMLAVVLAMGVGCSGQEQAGDAAPAPAEAPAADKALSDVQAVVEDALELPEGAARIGETITVAEPVKLATLRETPDDYFEKTILVDAEAAAVCQTKGCWLTMTDGVGEPIWVRWSSGCGGKYAFPKDLAGKRILVQGSFYEKEIDEKAAEHLAEESGKLEAEEIVGKTFEMNATACVIFPAEEKEEAAEGV